ncbi:MAG TPA: hypothetical protein VIP70_13505 [Nitrososphaeraceae archaeon]
MSNWQNRVFPLIIKKIDDTTLLQKVDEKLLVQKVFPYLDVTVVATQRLGQVSDEKVSGIKFKTAQATASCAPDEIAVGGGFWHSTGGDIKYLLFLRIY